MWRIFIALYSFNSIRATEDYFELYPIRVISYPYLKDKQTIDMYKVFHHGFVKNSIYPLKYRDLQLDTVATGMIGYGKYIRESTASKLLEKMFYNSQERNRESTYYAMQS
jgi:hypothetical protein